LKTIGFAKLSFFEAFKTLSGFNGSMVVALPFTLALLISEFLGLE